jgi:hypothetical protein
MATQTRDSLLAELRGFLAGYQKNLAASPLTVAGKAYTGAQILALLQSAIDVEVAVAQAEGVLVGLRASEKMFWEKNGKALKALRGIVGLMYADSIGTLADFGMEPRKPRAAMSTDTLLLRAAKAKATRTKRGTLGKRQKAALKGDVTGVIIQPIVGPSKTVG